MRPVSEPHLALLQAAQALRHEYADSGRGATLLEMVHRSQVGYTVARSMVPRLVREQRLCKVGERRVDYRNRPVAEYAPHLVPPEIDATPDDVDGNQGFVDLGHCMADWAR
jgi:hypothetical protein